jgi:CubicO group peptidase (beta-lactamase class C family)
MFSYNNAAFVVLGRVIEVLRGKCYDACLREHLFAPLGLAHAATSAAEAIMHRAAVGHLPTGPDGEPQPAPVWSLVRSNGPAGAVLAMSPRDLLAFARMHLAGGTAADGSTVLSPASVKSMRRRQVELPDLGMMGSAWGLGWEIFDWAGSGTAIGHDGGTIGQSAFLRVVPGHNVAIALLTNGGNPIAVYRAVYPYLVRELTGVEMPDFPTPPAAALAVDASRYVGTYASEVADLTVSQDADGRVWLEQTPKGILAELGTGTERHELVGYTGDTLLTKEPTHGLHMPHVFVGDDGDGHALYLHSGRATRRVP